MKNEVLKEIVSLYVLSGNIGKRSENRSRLISKLNEIGKMKTTTHNLKYNIIPYLQMYCIYDTKSTKHLKQKVRRQYQIEQYQPVIEQEIKNGTTLADIHRKHKIHKKIIREFLDDFAEKSIKDLVKANGIASNKTRWFSTEHNTNLSGESHPKFKRATKEQKEQLKRIVEDAIENCKNGRPFLSRTEIYRFFDDLGPYQVRHSLKEMGIDFRSLPHKSRNLNGELNRWYGKTPLPATSRGASGYILLGNKAFFFRSLLECHVFYSLWKNKTNFELCTLRIPYSVEGVNRTYLPDLVINGNIVCEIKPFKQLNISNIRTKFSVLVDYCDKNKYQWLIITDKVYNSYSRRSKQELKSLYENGFIWFSNQTSLEKFKRYLGEKYAN